MLNCKHDEIPALPVLYLPPHLYAALPRHPTSGSRRKKPALKKTKEAAALDTTKQDEKKEDPVSKSVIRGEATMQLRNENKSILSDMELVLCPATTADQIRLTRNERWRILASRSNFNDGYKNLDLQAIGSVAVKAALQRTKTDATGNYRFQDVPPGSYIIYGQYRSHYAVAYWVLPVKISTLNEDIVLPLNESNTKEAFNRFN
ncbi:MAG: hypothetical protein HC904_10010 [Blastochloris sp.]|nr:hypothetical protein [Blastochloris sp.]